MDKNDHFVVSLFSEELYDLSDDKTQFSSYIVHLKIPYSKVNKCKIKEYTTYLRRAQDRLNKNYKDNKFEIWKRENGLLSDGE